MMTKTKPSEQRPHKRPIVLLASRSLEMYQYFRTFVETNRICAHVGFLNMYVDLERGGHSVDERGFSRDDELVAWIRTFKRRVIAPDLIIVGTLDGLTTLYHDGIDGIPMGFVPKSAERQELARAISRIVG